MKAEGLQRVAVPLPASGAGRRLLGSGFVFRKGSLHNIKIYRKVLLINIVLSLMIRPLRKIQIK